MASISSLMGSSSSSSSIYGSRSNNIISGLASGLDTETLIEGMVQSYQQKILGLQQDRTKVQWQQAAYQSISDKLVEFSRKYTSYTSTTNLMSSSFFNNAVITSTKGKYADLVSATGKSSSDISILGVSQLASAARYQTTAVNLGSDGFTAKGSSVDLSKPMLINNMTGTLDISYNGNIDGTKADYLSGKTLSVTLNGQTKTITLDVQKDDGKGNEAVAKALQRGIDNAFGENRVKVGLDNGAFTFTTKESGSNFSIKSSSAGVSEMIFGEGNSTLTNYLDTSKTLGSLGTFAVDANDPTKATLTFNGIPVEGTATAVPESDRIKKEEDGVTYCTDKQGNKLDEEGYRINSDGERLYDFTLTINGESLTFNQDTALETVMNSINSNANMGVNVSYSKLTNQFVFTAKNTGAAEKIEMGGDLAGALFVGDSSKYEQGKDAIFAATVNGHTQTFTRSSNSVDLDGLKVNLEGTFNTFDTSKTTIADLGIEGSSLQFKVGDQDILIDITDTMTVADLEKRIQEKLGEGMTLQYDPATGYQVLDSNGQQVQITATGNAEDAEKFLNRESIDTNAEAVTFSTKTDTDTIVDAVKKMVEDYNAMVTEVKKAYSDTPLKKTDGSRYEPLTSDDEEGMTESEIKAYEEKAKTGILFMDSDLSSLYSSLRSAVVPGGSDGSYLRSIGINTSYSDGLTTISLDETALREALENDLDGVRNAFTKSKENGSATDGLMTSIQKVTDKYAATTGAVKGILIEKAGSQYSPTAALDNTMLNKMAEIDEEIEKWQDKMSDKVDYYTNKFTQLEMLINQMNSQSSALFGLTSG
ncbi:flagellar filament capping protein FliD [Intestinimonas sp. HCP28S3_D6]|uniref:flagellar filament capping protein FliD n=1 Tax=Intestinimonas sp. HCP28S3_D6 TaxID=3438942 RepID=UPI003F8C71DB